jgi:hypothetical protein
MVAALSAISFVIVFGEVDPSFHCSMALTCRGTRVACKSNYHSRHGCLHSLRARHPSGNSPCVSRIPAESITTYDYGGVGRGCGVGRGRGVTLGGAVGDGVADGVTEGVTVGVAVGVADGVTDGVAVGVTVGVGVGVGVGAPAAQKISIDATGTPVVS